MSACDSEKWLEHALCITVADRHGVTVKLSDPTRAGLPDRLILWPGGVAEFVEVKSAGEKPRALQLAAMHELTRLGFKYTLMDSEIALEKWQNSLPGLTKPK